MENKKGQMEMVTIITITAFVICTIILAMGFDSVAAGHIGVKERMGVIDPTPWGPGIQWTGILTSTQDFDTRIQLYNYDVSAFSSDAQVVRTNVAVNFRIDPSRAPEIYKNIGEGYQAIIIAPIVQETVKANTAKYELDSLVGKREAVKAAITLALTNKLENKGIIVTEVSLTNFQFSDEVQTAIENKQVAAQDALASENKLAAMEFDAQAMKLQEDFVEIKKLDLQAAWIARWDGSTPTTLIMGSDNTDLILSLPGAE